jgi:hypothetical protein
LQREDYYLSFYSLEYYILEKRTNSLNYKRIIKARGKIRAKVLIGYKSTIVYSKEFIVKQKYDKLGINNPMFDKK